METTECEDMLVRTILSLQVVGSDFSPVQVGVSTDPNLIRSFIENQRMVLQDRLKRAPRELREHETRLSQAREAILDMALDLAEGKAAANLQQISDFDRQRSNESRKEDQDQ